MQKEIPSFSDMMPELFLALKELGGSGTNSEINTRTLELLHLPEEIVEVPHKGGNCTEIEYRLAWTRTYMKKAGILTNSERAIWSLSPIGQKMDSVNPTEIVNSVRQMIALTKSSNDASNLLDDDLENDGVDIPEEIQGWREKLKNVLYNLPPAAFERLTQRILRESGFTQVVVTGRTGDGGIDGVGIVKLNGIISFHMLFQCKRYQGSVSSSDMRDFRGAMSGRADKGLFITTGKFTRAAIEEAARPGTAPIDLIDGDELVEKLKELHLGVIPVADYQIDEKWFSEI